MSDFQIPDERDQIEAPRRPRLIPVRCGVCGSLAIERIGRRAIVCNDCDAEAYDCSGGYEWERHPDETGSCEPCVLGPMELSLLLHAHAGEPVPKTGSFKRAARYLLRRGLIHRTDNNLQCPYGNLGVAHALVCAVLKTPIPEEG